MKTIIKIIIGLFIALIVFGIYKGATMTESDKTKMALERINEGLYKINSFSELEKAYKEVDELQKKDSTGEFKALFKEIYDHKQAAYERVTEGSIKSNKAYAYDMAIEFISKGLKSPSTAKFQSRSEVNARYDVNSKLYIIELYVDAQNSFGAVLRNYYHVEMAVYGDTWTVKKIYNMNE